MTPRSGHRLVHETNPSGWPVLVSLCALLLAGLAAAQDAERAGEEDDPGYQVIVHVGNPASEMPADAVAKMFRKKIKRWDHDVDVKPVDLDPDSPVRKAFTRGVHNKSMTAIQSYWLRMIFSGRDAPPEVRTTEDEVVAFVGTDPGAIGYVSAGKTLSDGVRQLKITP